MSTELVQKTAEMVRKKFEKSTADHDWEHTRRVWQIAKKIAEKEKADTEIAELGALLHDIADWKEHDNDAALGEQKAQEWLEQNNASARMIEKVCDAIHDVSFKGNWKSAPESPEGKIVQDADRLDVLGAMGIVRSITWAPSKKGRFITPRFRPA